MLSRVTESMRGLHSLCVSSQRSFDMSLHDRSRIHYMREPGIRIVCLLCKIVERGGMVVETFYRGSVMRRRAHFKHNSLQNVQ